MVDFPAGNYQSGYNGWVSGAGVWVYSDGVYVPKGRIMANGQGPIIANSIRAWASGWGGSINMQIGLGSGATGVFTMSNGGSSYSSNPTYDTGWRGISAFFANGGSTRVSMGGNRGINFNRANPGNGSTRNTADGYVWNSAITGQYSYVEGPSEPRSLSVSSPVAGSATVNFVGPSSNGGTGITDYILEYSQSSSFASGVTRVAISGSNHTVSGLSLGATYYFRVAARNAVTNTAGTWSKYSNTASVQTATVPGAVPSPAVVAVPDGVHATWGVPSTGGVPITGYEVQVDDNNTFSSPQTVQIDPNAARAKTIIDLAPGSTQYVRIRAKNAVGNGSYSSTVSTALAARSFMDGVALASVNVGARQVAINSDGATTPALTLGHYTTGAGTTFQPIAALPMGAVSGSYAFSARIDGFALTADTDGNLFVVGRDGTSSTSVLIRRYAKTGDATWVASGSLSVSLGSGEPLAQFAAEWTPGTGQTGTPTILVLARRAGATGSGNISYATVKVSNITSASSTNAVVASGSDPSWLPVPGTTGAANAGKIDAVSMSGGTSSRVAVAANGFAVIENVNGQITSVSKSPNSTVTDTDKLKVVPINSSTFATVVETANDLKATFLNASGVQLGTVTVPASYALGAAFEDEWAAWFDRQAQVLTINYIGSASGRTLQQVQISPQTYTLFTPTTLTSSYGAASTTNSKLRAPSGLVDERNVVINGAGNAAGTQSLSTYVNNTGNVAPTAPSLNSKTVFDRDTTQTFTWSFGDPNILDAQSAYELEIYRVDTGASVLDTGKVSSTASSYTLPTGTLDNDLQFRWQVRTWDVLDTAGSFSNFSTFRTSDAGTVAITSPAADYPVSDLNYQDITWTWTHTGPATQSRYRVRVYNNATNALLSDTGWIASSATTHRVTGLQTDLQQRIEVVVESSDGLESTAGVRRVSPSYGLPMTPTFALSSGEGYIQLSIDNPTPTGSRPEVIQNEVWKRASDETEFLVAGRTGYNGVYRDYAVASNKEYFYFVRGISEEVI